ncbi:hypothetical protein [Bradyrhizobium lablabi]|nr:hypothetical protein [Bradyrhizobium lablabi]
MQTSHAEKIGLPGRLNVAQLAERLLLRDLTRRRHRCGGFARS